MVLGSGAYIYIREAEIIGYQSALRDCACGDTGYNVGLLKVLEDDAAELGLDERAHFGV